MPISNQNFPRAEGHLFVYSGRTYRLTQLDSEGCPDCAFYREYGVGCTMAKSHLMDVMRLDCVKDWVLHHFERQPIPEQEELDI